MVEEILKKHKVKWGLMEEKVLRFELSYSKLKVPYQIFNPVFEKYKYPNHIRLILNMYTVLKAWEGNELGPFEIMELAMEWFELNKDKIHKKIQGYIQFEMAYRGGYQQWHSKEDGIKELGARGFSTEKPEFEKGYGYLRSVYRDMYLYESFNHNHSSHEKTPHKLEIYKAQALYGVSGVTEVYIP